MDSSYFFCSEMRSSVQHMPFIGEESRGVISSIRPCNWLHCSVHRAMWRNAQCRMQMNCFAYHIVLEIKINDLRVQLEMNHAPPSVDMHGGRKNFCK